MGKETVLTDTLTLFAMSREERPTFLSIMMVCLLYNSEAFMIFSVMVDLSFLLVPLAVHPLPLYNFKLFIGLKLFELQ